MTEKTRIAQFGPLMPMVPVGDFRKFRLEKSVYEGMWRIVGPSAELNLRSHPLWMVITMAYMEGLYHGAGLQEEICVRDAKA